MPGAYLWIWDTDNSKWVKLAGTSAGAMSIHAIVEELNDIEDVDVAAPTDGYILYWDDGESKWKCKAAPAGAWASITGKPDSPTLEELATEHEADGTHGDITPSSCAEKYTDAAAVAAAKTVKLDDFTAPEDNTDLDAAAALHGLMPKADKSKLDAIAANADVTGDNAPQAHAASHQNGEADEISVAGLSGLLADDQHVIDAEALAAAVQAGAITNGITKAPTHDAVFDVKTTADAAEPAASDAADAVTAMGAKADDNPLNHDRYADTEIRRIFYVKVFDAATAVATGEGKAYITIPYELNGMNLVKAHAAVYTASSSGLPCVGIYNLTDTVEMLSTDITIDENEYSSYSATTQPVIDTDHDDVAQANKLRIDVSVAGTGTKGLDVILTFQLP